jgi:hypothetical protein
MTTPAAIFWGFPGPRQSPRIGRCGGFVWARKGYGCGQRTMTVTEEEVVVPSTTRRVCLPVPRVSLIE